MPTSTTNYGLIKPGTDDPILIEQLNDNADTIDAALKENADAIENKPDAADIPSPSTAAPAMDGTAAAGTSTNYARADHVHPSDTSKQDALTTAQLAATNSGIDSTKVEQIETNKNNISYLENTGKKNWLKPNTISGVPTGLTVQYESDDSITINGTYSGSEYAYVHLHSFTHEAMQYTFSCNVATSASTFYFFTLDNKMSTNLTPTYIYTENGTTRVVMRIAPNTSFDNVNVKLMIRPSIIADSTYQPYAMSNVELTNELNVSQLTLSYTQNSYVDQTAFNRMEMRKVAPHIAIFNLNLYNVTIGVTTDFVEIGTITGELIGQTAMVQQGNFIVYLQGGTNKIKVYCSNAGTYTLRTSIAIVI